MLKLFGVTSEDALVKARHVKAPQLFFSSKWFSCNIASAAMNVTKCTSTIRCPDTYDFTWQAKGDIKDDLAGHVFLNTLRATPEQCKYDPPLLAFCPTLRILKGGLATGLFTRPNPRSEGTKKQKLRIRFWLMPPETTALAVTAPRRSYIASDKHKLPEARFGAGGNAGCWDMARCPKKVQLSWAPINAVKCLARG